MPHQYPFSDLSELNYSKERRILNEQMFLDMNSRIKESATKLVKLAKLKDSDMVLSMACECSDASCLQKIKVDISTFDKIHEIEGQYMIVSGHNQSDIEEVISEHENYVIVKKFVAEVTSA